MSSLENGRGQVDAYRHADNSVSRREEDKHVLGRRGFVGGGIGVGVAAFGMALGCSNSASPSKVSSDEDASSIIDAEGSVRVVPASSMAQSMMSLLVPESLASMVDGFSVGEQPRAIDVSALPCTGAFSEDGINAFAQIVSAASPDLILDVGFYEQSRDAALLELQDATGVPYVLLNLKEIMFSDAVSSLAATLKIDDVESKVEALKRIESAMEKASTIPDDERFIVYLGGGRGRVFGIWGRYRGKTGA